MKSLPCLQTLLVFIFSKFFQYHLPLQRRFLVLGIPWVKRHEHNGFSDTGICFLVIQCFTKSADLEATLLLCKLACASKDLIFFLM